MRQIVIVAVAFCALLAGNSGATTGPLVLQPTEDVLAGYNAAKVAAADFNGDGFADLAVATQGSSVNNGAIAVLLNDGSGAMLPPAIYSTNGFQIAICAADLDGDGHVDIATTISIALEGGGSSSELAILFNDGAGAFRTPVRYPSPGDSYEILSGDFDGDNDVDLVSVCANYQSVLYYNAGDGTFPTMVVHQYTHSGRSLAAADYDGDGDLDLARLKHGIVAGRGGVEIYINDGSGSFTEKGTYNGADESDLARIISSDFDNDGDQDIAYVAYDSAYIKVMLNNGDATFQPPVRYGLPSYCRALRAADFNGDGLNDLIAATRANLVQFTNLGDGTFRQSFVTGIAFGEDIAACDLDMNGTVDVALLTQVGSSYPYETRATTYLNLHCTGDVDGSGAFADVADLTYLLDFLMLGGAPPADPNSGDVDRSGVTDIADLSYIVDYLFAAGPAPVCVP